MQHTRQRTTARHDGRRSRTTGDDGDAVQRQIDKEATASDETTKRVKYADERQVVAGNEARRAAQVGNMQAQEIRDTSQQS